MQNTMTEENRLSWNRVVDIIYYNDLEEQDKIREEILKNGYLIRQYSCQTQAK